MVLHLSADNAESAYMDQEPIKTRVGPDFPDLHKHTVEHRTVSEKHAIQLPTKNSIF